MTKVEQLEGRELNEALATALGYRRERVPDDMREALFGKTWRERPDTLWRDDDGRWCVSGLPDWYGGDAAAMTLIEQCTDYVEIQYDPRCDGPRWYCHFDGADGLGDTLSEATARAVLRALGGEGEGV